MRIKRGIAKKQKHKKVLKMAKGYRMSYSKLYRRAKEAVMHAGVYSYIDRKHRKGQKREEWIMTISAALVGSGLSYSKFIHGLKKNNIEIDRKNLSDMIINNRSHFEVVLAESKK
jgi:large subunit ribosomal protein L20